MVAEAVAARHVKGPLDKPGVPFVLALRSKPYVRTASSQISKPEKMRIDSSDSASIPNPVMRGLYYPRLMLNYIPRCEETSVEWITLQHRFPAG